MPQKYITDISCISNSDGTCLHFVTAEEDAAYEREARQLMLKHYAILRGKYGVYATNQGRYVKNSAALNEYDSKVMEELFLQKDAKTPPAP